MPNKNYEEQGEGKADDGRVKGKTVGPGVTFKAPTWPNSDNAKDEEEFSGFGKVKTDVKMPGEPGRLSGAKNVGKSGD